MVTSVFFALPTVLASEVGYKRKTIEPKRLAADSWMCHDDTSNGSFLGDVCVAMSQTTARSREVVTTLFSCVVTTPLHPPLHGCKHGMGSLASVGRMLAILVFWRWSSVCVGEGRVERCART